MRPEDLERELRAERPELDPEFARKLDEWTAAGFPRGGSVDPRPAGPRRDRGGIPAGLHRAWKRVAGIPPQRLVGTAGAAALAIVIVGVSVSQVNLGGTDSEMLGSESDGAGGTAVEQSAPDDGVTAEPAAPAAGDNGGGAATPAQVPGSDEHQLELDARGDSAASTVAPIPPGGGGDGVARGREDRLQDKTARLSLGAEADEVQDVANAVVQVTDRHDGIVLDSQVTSDRGGARAGFQLEIPFTELDAALTDLSELGDVISRTEASEDITQPFVRAQRHHAATLEKIQELRVKLIEADTSDERLVIKSQIDALKAEADAYAAQRDRTAREARFASVAVDITSNGSGSGDDGWTLGDAVDDAGDVLRTLAGIGLVSLAILVPVALVGALAFRLVATARHRSRERALD